MAKASARHSSPNRGLLIAGAIVILLGGGALGGVAGSALLHSNTNTQTSCDAAKVANTVLPSIVTVLVSSTESGQADSNGSGQIISSDGYVVTNNHVVAPAADGGSVAVRLSDGETYSARIVGRDPKTDLAVIKLEDAKRLPVIAQGDSTTLSVGEPVVALGSPLGLSSTVTAGIVSALGRTVPLPAEEGSSAVLVGAIQTDAAINPGNSGGALVDCSGRLIGVNTAIASVPGSTGNASSGSVGIGFAIPIAQVMPITRELIDHGHVSHPSAGATVTAIPPAVAQRFGITDGLFVQAVTADGPAAHAGIRPGDIITALNGHSAHSVDILTAIQVSSKPGTSVKVTFVRGGHEHTVTVTLA